MRLHQVLTGAANVFDNSVAVCNGNASGYPFTVYGSGYEVVVLDSHFNRVQILSSQDSSITSTVKCIACGTLDGKVAVSYGTKVILYAPQLDESATFKKLPYRWKKVAVLDFDNDVWKMCWDKDGGRLLIGSLTLSMWRRVSHIDDEEHEWSCIWKRRLASPVHLMEFSPDGHFFASCGQNDCMVKIWFRAPKVSCHDQEQDEKDFFEEDYNFIYVLHPEPVQSFSWRKTSKHMPLCMIPNVLLTSCADDVCRIWTETVKYKPSHHSTEKKQGKSIDELLRKERAESDLKQKTANQMRLDEKIHAQQHYHLVSMFHFHLAAVINPITDIALLSAIPNQSIFGRSFQLQWLNNKEVAVEAIFASIKDHKAIDTTGNTTSTDPFLMVDEIDGNLEFSDYLDTASDVKTLDQTLEEDQMEMHDFEEAGKSAMSLKPPNISPAKEAAEVDTAFSAYQHELNSLIFDWCSSSDTLYCIHPVDGSLLIWVVDYIDDFTSAYYRQVQVSFASRIPATFSKADATSLCWTSTFHYTEAQLNPSFSTEAEEHIHNSICKTKNLKKTDKLAVLQSSYMVSAHADGSLNLWLVTFSDSGSFTGVASITHITRSCGPRFGTTQLVTHPSLPLVIGTSQRNNSSFKRTNMSNNATLATNNDIESELILWNTNHVSPLSEFKGVTEMARISSPDPNKFLCISWVPELFHFSLVSITNDGIDLLPNAPSAGFIAATDNGICLYQILLDSKTLLSNLGMLKFSASLPHHMQILSDLIESEQSGSQSACIMNVCHLDHSDTISNVQFLHVFNKQTVSRKQGSSASTIEEHDEEDAAFNRSYTTVHDEQEFFVLAVYEDNNDYDGINHRQKFAVWKLTVSSHEKFVSTLSPVSVEGDDLFSPSSPPAAPIPTSLAINHCVNQQLVYDQKVSSSVSHTWRLFSATAGLHSSNEFCSSLPVKYHFTAISSLDNALDFWELVLDENNKLDVQKCHQVGNKLSSGETVVSLACASSSRLAFITQKEALNNRVDYSLVVKENETSGEEQWNTEYSRLFYPDVEFSPDRECVKISWLSLENGQFLLAVAVNNEVFIFCKNRTPVLGSSKGTKHVFDWTVLKKVKVQNDFNDVFRLTTISWSSAGFFMVGVENEIQVYAQWEDNIEVMFKIRSQLANILSDSKEQGVTLTTNSFSMACEKMCCLPQYHPDYLIQLLNLGKVRRIRAILRHLVRCVAGAEAADAASVTTEIDTDDTESVHLVGRSRARTLTQTYSNLSQSMVTEVSYAELDEKKTDPDIDVVPPLTLTALLLADKDHSGTLDDKKNESAVFYSLNQANLLTEKLSKKHLPGLSSQKQMYLLALSDTIASSNDVDIEGIESEDRKYRTEAAHSSHLASGGGGGGGYATTGATTGVGDFTSDAVDECGLRFLILLRHHTTILKSLTPKQRASMEQAGMLSSEYCWAFHSECTEELLAMMPGMKRNEPSWPELRSHGAGWWVRSNDILKRTIEKVAKTHFQIKKDPLDSAIFYLAMKKKSLICALFRSLRDTKMSTFFSNDFTQERWRKAALKNAYALLGKQRFEHAAAFFILGNALWDAVQVCVTRLHDIQLALVISRLYENNMEGTHERTLKTYVLGLEDEPLHEDPFKRSMAHWLMKDYRESVDVFLFSFQDSLLSEDLGDNSTGPVTGADDHFDYPSVFNFYTYLLAHPLLRRRHLSQHRSSGVGGANHGVLKTPLNRQVSVYTSQLSQAKQWTGADVYSLQRSLCFHTACIHLNSGMPDIALEVLSMLPRREEESAEDATTLSGDSQILSPSSLAMNNEEEMIVTGTFSGDLSSGPSHPSYSRFEPYSSSSIFDNNMDNERVSSFSSNNWGSDMDDFQQSSNRFSDLDDGYKIGISLSDSDDDDDSENKEDNDKPQEEDNDMKATSLDLQIEEMKESGKKNSPKNNNNKDDIAALNLKFRCIIQLLIEGLKALPSKCTLENLKLRKTLKTMVQRELEFLHLICDYDDGSSGNERRNRSHSVVNNDSVSTANGEWNEKDSSEQPKTYRSLSSISDSSTIMYPHENPSSSASPTLCEKVEQISVQSEWLKQNQKILASLYEHCLMVGTRDPELPAVCLELLLLLYEIEDHRVLSAPLTSISVGPSAPPLLLASISSFSLVSSPVVFLQSMTHDLLQTVIDLPKLPTPISPAKRLADLESLMCSLSSCIYHSLCGGDDDQLLTSIAKGETQLVGKQMKDGKLCRIPHGATNVDIEVTSTPAKWPGVKFFLSILSANKKEERHALNLLLCESAVAVYLSFFVSACSRLSCNNLYRFVNNSLTEEMWNNVFGGGTRVVIPAPDGLTKKSQSPLPAQQRPSPLKDTARMRWNYKLLGKQPSFQGQQQSDENAQVSYNNAQKLVRHEMYIPPKLSLCDYFLKKPKKNHSFDYDSDNESDDSDTDDNDGDVTTDVEDDGLVDEAVLRQRLEEKRKKRAKLFEHFDSTSYPWLIMQLALVEITIKNINDFITMAGFELSDLPTQSTLLYNATKILIRWEQLLVASLDSYTVEENLINIHPPSSAEGGGVFRGGLTLQKTKLLLDPDNTPFSNFGRRVHPCKRLWYSLAQKEIVRSHFLYYAFKSPSSVGEDSIDSTNVITGHLLHKDPEPVTNFCVNRSSNGFMAISTVHEIIEYDISGSMEADAFSGELHQLELVSDLMKDKKHARAKSQTPVEMQRRQCPGMRRMAAHPNLPYYVVGGNDGSVRMFEFIHPDQIALFRPPGQTERINKIAFNPMGNKFAAVDDSGYLSIWQVANTQDTTPFFSMKCHSKHCYDFAFVGSSSLIVTVGHSSDKRNIFLWDTLLSPRKALVHGKVGNKHPIFIQSFSHGTHGAHSVLYAPGQQTLITGGKRGGIYGKTKGIFDMRHKRLLHTFQGHDSFIKAMTLDPMEMFFASGSVEGDVKIWSISGNEAIESYPREHARASVSLRHVSPGVQCLRVVGPRKLFSCGGDGTVKWRYVHLDDV